VTESPELPRVDPRYQKHCVIATIIGPDHSRRDVIILSDTGALQSLVSSSIVNEHEVLSYQGSHFMSELMQIFLTVFGISHIRSSPYHPQTNGACERFNGTLKKMLMSLTDKFPDSWDEALPWVLFAYREVPV